MYYAPTLDSMCTTRLHWTPCVLHAYAGLHVYHAGSMCTTLDSMCAMLDPCVLRWTPRVPCWIHVCYAGSMCTTLDSMCTMLDSMCTTIVTTDNTWQPTMPT